MTLSEALEAMKLTEDDLEAADIIALGDDDFAEQVADVATTKAARVLLLWMADELSEAAKKAMTNMDDVFSEFPESLAVKRGVYMGISGQYMRLMEHMLEQGIER